MEKIREEYKMDKIREVMKQDFELACESYGIDFETVDYEKVEKDNLEKFKAHLEEYGEISEYEYIKEI